MRIQGLPEDGPGEFEDKLLELCNESLALSPPLQIEEIEVAHRLHRPRNDRDTPADAAEDTDNADAMPPRSVIVKFVSRRTK